MQPPPPLDFVSTETVRQLYAAMPTVFARDIARAKGQSIPPQSVPTLKRERPTDEPELAMMKRRDMGDSKAGTGMPPPATPALAPKSVHPAQPFAGGVPQAAMHDPARMVQMRQQQAQFQAQTPQVQQPHMSGVRQMSPPQATNTGVGMGVGQPQVQGQQTAAHANAVQQIVNSFGPQGLALMNQLQDPNNALVKYLVEQIPNFLSLPLHQQLKSMQHAQVRFTIFCLVPLWLTAIVYVEYCTTETNCSAAAAAAATTTTTTTEAGCSAAAAAATIAAAATSAATSAAAAAAITTSTTTSTTSITAQPTANTAAKLGQSKSRRAFRSHANQFGGKRN